MYDIVHGLYAEGEGMDCIWINPNRNIGFRYAICETAIWSSNYSIFILKSQ